VFSAAALVPSVEAVRETLAVGAPPAGRGLFAAVVRVALVGVVAAVAGAPGLAAYTVGARTASVAFVPARGLGQAARSMVGQSLGADRPTRADRTTLVGLALGAGVLGLVGVAQWLAPGSVAATFVPDPTAAGRNHARTYLRVLALGYPAIGATELLVAGFDAAPRPRVGRVVALPRVAGLGVDAVFWAVTLSNVAAAAGLAVHFARERDRGLFSRATASGGED
jgi:Na+-driven multidrug efflux pump